MDSRDFFDTVYAMWSKTTGAKDAYWMPDKCGDGLFELFSVDESQERKHLASFVSNEDADFITAVHGCFPDLIRALHTAFDEADRKDYEKDDLENRIATLELESDVQERDLEVLSAEVVKKDERIAELESLLRDADLEVHYLSARVQDLEGL